jgi:hypothetical protein
MENKVFSYCLFEPKTLPQHRFWDKDKNNPQRYWFNIPALAVINNILYPDYLMRIYVSPNVWDNPLSQVLRALAQEIGPFNVETIDREYSLTEPAIWRMMPLWSHDISTFHTRDLDSVPNEEEYRFVRAFEKSSCCLGTIRTHENHYGLKCRMLAGLSSFKPQLIPPQLKWDSFNTYYAMRHNQYGSDQDLMIKFFTGDETFTKDHFFDFAACNQRNKQDFLCTSATDEEIFAFDLGEKKSDILALIKKCFGEFWSGVPMDSRGELLSSLLCYEPRAQEQIKQNAELRQFYKL